MTLIISAKVFSEAAKMDQENREIDENEASEEIESKPKIAKIV